MGRQCEFYRAGVGLIGSASATADAEVLALAIQSLLRAGLKVLAGLSDSALRSALQAVPSIKTGRPKADAAEPAPTTPAKPATKASGKAGRK